MDYSVLLLLVTVALIAATVVTGIYAVKLHNTGLGLLCFFLFLMTFGAVNHLIAISSVANHIQ
jgi:hypothetical protein